MSSLLKSLLFSLQYQQGCDLIKTIFNWKRKPDWSREFHLCRKICSTEKSVDLFFFFFWKTKITLYSSCHTSPSHSVTFYHSNTVCQNWKCLIWKIILQKVSWLSIRNWWYWYLIIQQHGRFKEIKIRAEIYCWLSCLFYWRSDKFYCVLYNVRVSCDVSGFDLFFFFNPRSKS